MLLACSGDASTVAVEAMQYLLQEGAVPDTWAPNGSSVSCCGTWIYQALKHRHVLCACCFLLCTEIACLQALMLAASVDGIAAIQLLLKHGATIELQVRLAVRNSRSPDKSCHLAPLMIPC